MFRGDFVLWFTRGERVYRYGNEGVESVRAVSEVRVEAKNLLTASDVAKRLQLSIKTVQRWLKSGRLPIPYLRLPNGRYRVRVEELDRYVEDQSS